jgi:hypothetical protein
MPITKILKTPIGVDATHFVADTLTYDLVNNKGKVLVHCFVNATADKPIHQLFVDVVAPLPITAKMIEDAVNAIPENVVE